MLRIDEIFKITWGNKAYHSKGHLKELPGRIPLVASGDDPYTFGTHGFYDIPARLRGVITVASTGSAGATYFRGYDCDVSDDALILTPREPTSDVNMIWYQEAIRALRPMWSYGRKVTPEKLGRIRIPSPPEWVAQHSQIDLEEMRRPEVAKEDVRATYPKEWFDFRLIDVFDLIRGGSLGSTEASAKPGKVPFIGASKTNNGLITFTGARPAEHAGGKLTLVSDGQGGMGYCFYQHLPFLASPNLTVLSTKHGRLTPNVGVFLATVITELRPLYSYGRKMNLQRLQTITIKLPSVDQGASPAWDVIEDYMQGLPFSAIASAASCEAFAGPPQTSLAA